MAETIGNEVIGIGTIDFGPPPHFVYREWTFPAPLTDDEHERIADVFAELFASSRRWMGANGH